MARMRAGSDTTLTSVLLLVLCAALVLWVRLTPLDPAFVDDPARTYIGDDGQEHVYLGDRGQSVLGGQTLRSST